MSEPHRQEPPMEEPELSASESASLERGYRRRLAWYPRWFRVENEDEILAVLLACAEDNQTRPSLEATFDLLKGAARMWMRPRPGQPRTVFTAIRLMWAGALAEVTVAITTLATLGSVRVAVLHAYRWPGRPGRGVRGRLHRRPGGHGGGDRPVPHRAGRGLPRLQPGVQPALPYLHAEHVLAGLGGHRLGSGL
jgi:hypothetical protein